jgi:hypothetical protein
MKYTKKFLVLICLLVAACTDKYEQQYQTYSDFDKVNQRNKGWFPNIISTDAYNLKNASYLDSLCAFGTFSYSNNYFYDSIFNNTEINKINFSKFEQKVNKHFKRRPDWFVKTDKISESEYQTIQQDRFYIVRHSKDKKVYFILSN